MAELATTPDWRTYRFDEIAVNVNERVEPGETGLEHYVGLEHLDGESLKIRRWGTPDDVDATKLLFQKGDIIFGRRRVYQRKLAVAEFDGICSAHAMVLRPRPDVVLPEFLPFFMQSDLFMNRAMEISVGSLSPTINWKTLARQEFALPPLAEQRRIAKVLKSLLLTTEQLDGLVNASRQLVNSFTKSVFISEDWPLRRFEDYVSSSLFGPRFSNRLYSSEGALACIRTTDMSVEGTIDYESVPRVDIEPDKFSKHILEIGDFMISRSGTCGIGSVFEGHDIPTIPGAFLIRFRLTGGLNPYYLKEYVNSPVGQRHMAKLARGAVQKNISGSVLLSENIPIPHISEQTRFVETVRELRGTTHAVEDRRRTLSTVSQGLLNQILSQ